MEIDREVAISYTISKDVAQRPGPIGARRTCAAAKCSSQADIYQARLIPINN